MHQVVADQNFQLKEALKRLRIGYYRELDFLREKLKQAEIAMEKQQNGSSESAFAQREKFIQDTEVYFYDVREGIFEPELKDLFEKTVKSMERHLLAEVYSLRKQLEKAGLQEPVKESQLGPTTASDSRMGAYGPDEVSNSLSGTVGERADKKPSQSVFASNSSQSDSGQFPEAIKSEDERRGATEQSISDIKRLQTESRMGESVELISAESQTMIQETRDTGSTTDIVSVREMLTQTEKGSRSSLSCYFTVELVPDAKEIPDIVKAPFSGSTQTFSFLVSRPRETRDLAAQSNQPDQIKSSDLGTQTSVEETDSFSQTEEEKREIDADINESNDIIETYLRSFKRSFSLNLMHDPLKVLRHILLEQRRTRRLPNSSPVILPPISTESEHLLGSNYLKREVLRLKAHMADLEGRLSVERKRLHRAIEFINEIKEERDEFGTKAVESIRKARSVREQIRKLRIEMTLRDRRIHSLSRALLSTREIASSRSLSPASVRSLMVPCEKQSIDEGEIEPEDDNACIDKVETSLLQNFSFEPLGSSLQSTDRGSTHRGVHHNTEAFHHLYNEGLLRGYSREQGLSIRHSNDVDASTTTGVRHA